MAATPLLLFLPGSVRPRPLPPKLLPPKLLAEKFVALTPFHVEPLNRKRFEEQFHGADLGSMRAALLLRRRNDVTMYGKLHDTYPADTPEYMAMSISNVQGVAGCVVSSPAACSPLSEDQRWDAILVVRPLNKPVMRPGTPCFLAMNRFIVKPDEASRRLFEERWALRNSKLAAQAGFVGFSLLRREAAPDVETGASDRFTYATATLWASQANWTAWREGGGRNAHAVSRESSRTPVSEWMAGSASPIFWDVPVFWDGSDGRQHVVRSPRDGGDEALLNDDGVMSGGSRGDDPGGETSNSEWDASLARLAEYSRQWGNADAPMKTELGDWCAEQRRMHASGGLAAARVSALDGLGFSWRSPTDVDDPVTQHDWPAMCARLRAYKEEHRSTDVPKKYQRDPRLGGWVAAVRRCRSTLGETKVAELDELGFQWTSSRQCGSAFQISCRQLRAFWVEHGHTDVGRVLGSEHVLALWCDAQRTAWREGRLSPKRVAPLDELGVFS